MCGKHYQRCRVNGSPFKIFRVRHGKKNSKIYAVWSGMKKRCHNPLASNYNLYGGRGICISKEWENFVTFYRDMGDAPKGTSLDRIDNDKGYCKENCRWATQSQQSRNTRRNVIVEYMGRKQCLIEWTNELNLNYKIMAQRIRSGWEPTRAIETPIRKKVQSGV